MRLHFKPELNYFTESTTVVSTTIVSTTATVSTATESVAGASSAALGAQEAIAIATAKNKNTFFISFLTLIIKHVL